MNESIVRNGTSSLTNDDTILPLVHVFVQTKPGTEQAFLEASLKNARHSAQEKGILRFDVLQDKEDPCKFVLVEVYTDATTAPAAHKETAHYLEWRSTVEDMMAQPRQACKYVNHFPTSLDAWKYPRSEGLED